MFTLCFKLFLLFISVIIYRGPEITITEEGFFFWELGQQDTIKKSANRMEQNQNELHTSIREVNIVNIDNNNSSSGEEQPQDYKPAEYLKFHPK